MSTQRRIQLRRTKGYHKPEGAIVVARPSVWGNSWTVEDFRSMFGGPVEQGRQWAAAKFRSDWVAVLGNDNEIHDRLGYPPQTPVLNIIREQLRGHDLACWCPLDQPCHADILLELANEEAS